MHGIRRRTFLYCSTIILIITLVISVALTFYFANTLRQRIENDQMYATRQTANNVDALFSGVQLQAYYLCSNSAIPDLLIRPGDSTYRFNQLQKTFSLTSGPLSTPLMQYASVSMLIEPKFPLTNDFKGYDFSLDVVGRQRLFSSAAVQDEEWYKETVARNGQIHTFVDADTGYVYFTYLLRSIHIADPRYNNVVGVVIYKLPLSRIQSTLAGGRVTEGTEVLLLCEDTVLSNTGLTSLRAGDKLPQEALALSELRSEKSAITVQLGRNTYAASGVTLYGRWRVVTLIPSGELLIHFKELLPVFALSAVVLIFIGFVLSALFARRLTRPILTLSGIMSQTRDSDDLPATIQLPTNNDEITQLYQSYNAMTERIRVLTEQTRNEEEERRAAELHALQAQINPHFIYNTLDSVACIALISGQDDIVTMVTSLTDILKYSIQFSRATVTLREELSYLDRYISIQHLRYTDGFVFNCNVPSCYDNVSISQIILQPLVENALFHAVRPEGRLEINLFCEEEEEKLLIHVTDNGSNADADALNSLLDGDEVKMRHGIGICNVHQRIRLHMGEAYGLHYAALPTGGLDAVVTIPLRYI